MTIELVPFGVEEMAKTISELCIANVYTDSGKNEANYEACGYHITTGNKLEEFAMQIKSFSREGGALALVAEVLQAEQQELVKIPNAGKLIQRTRLFAETVKDDQ